MFVRGISNVTSIERIPYECENAVIGIVWSEMRSKDDTLSIWKIENREDFEDAALSIILPKSRIDAASFLIIEDNAFSENHIEIKQIPPEKEFVLDSKAIHYNMVNIRACSAPDVLRIYKSMYEKELKCVEEGMYIVSWTISEAGEKILEADKNGKIITSSLGTEMLRSIEKLKGKSQL